MSRKKIIFGVIGIILVLSIALAACSGSGSDSDLNRGLAGKTGGSSDDEKEEIVKKQRSYDVYDGHLDTVIMIYMIGSNLESQNGCATTDLHEICDGFKGVGSEGATVKFLVETGGSSEWKKDFKISKKKLQRYVVAGEDGLTLKEEVKSANMSKAATLSDFLDWGIHSYPADRYGLILWDHGGGTLSGYGYDENYPGSMMRLQKMKTVFDNLDTHLDFVGFDACLMSTFETAYMLSPHADYLIASEELEPGSGWYYTNWVNSLLKDPKIPIDKLATQLIDDFAGSNEKAKAVYTLSLIDLKKIGDVYDKMIEFSKGSTKELENMEFKKVSKARNSARSFGNGNVEQIDIIDFADKTDIEGRDELIDAVKNSVAYFKTNMEGANGLAMYYPFKKVKEYTRMLGTLEELNFDESYTKGMSEFCTVLAQSNAEENKGEDFASERWYSGDISRDYTGQTDIGLADWTVPIKDIDGEVFIDMTPEQLDMVVDPYLHVWLESDDHYIELGNDVYKRIDEIKDDAENNGMASAEYDNSWLMVNDQPVVFYLMDWGYKTDGTFYKVGCVPAVLNKGDHNYIFIRVEMYSAPPYDDMEISMRGYWHYEEGIEGGDNIRKLIPLKEGDVLEFLCLTYDEDENPIGLYYLNDEVTVTNDGIDFSYDRVRGRCQWRIMFDDVYDNEYKSCWIIGRFLKLNGEYRQE